ncbi:MAG: MFS transporter, partial [bacterium]|nr:MFS transporter [bacterium]
LLHGICYDFFFVTGQIYVDRQAPRELRASAQGFIALVTLGVGMLIGAKASGWVVQHYQIMDQAQKVTGHLWGQIWLAPAIMATVVLALFGLLFKETGIPVAAGAGAQPAGGESRSAPEPTGSRRG